MTSEEFQLVVLQQLKNLTEGQESLVKEVRALAAEQKALAAEQKTLAAEQKTLAAEIKEIRKDLARLESRVENEVIEKIRALFDAREVHEDNFKRVFKRLDRIEIDTGYLVARVARLELLAK